MPERASLHPIHPVSRRHLEAISDAVGIMQHAVGSRPDPTHGYCVDDVARSLQVDLLQGRELGWDEVAESAWRGIRFLGEAFDGTTGQFRNFRAVDGSWTDGPGSEDCQGRAFHALGDTIADAPDDRMVATATALFGRAAPAARRVTALRAQASVLLGSAAGTSGDGDDHGTAAFRDLAARFHARFTASDDPTWPWPESSLTYENALPARALIVAGQRLGSDEMIDDGIRALDWQIESQIASDGHLSPVGNGSWPRGGEKSRFDQQPIEATAMLLGAEAAYESTGFDRHRAAVELAYGWFLGANDLGLDLADPERGACYDGLTPRGVNTNQGAESTLMWLIAAEHVRAIRDGRPQATEPHHLVPVG